MSKEIIVVTMSLGGGGAERVLSQLIDAWVNAGNHVILVQTNPEFYKKKYSINKNVKIIDINIKSSNRMLIRVKRAINLIHILRKHPNAIAIAFVNPAILLLSISSIFVKNYIIFSERCDPSNSPPERWRRVIRNFLYNFCDCCVFQTSDAKKYFNRRIREKGHIIPNPSNPNLPEIHKGDREKIIVAACQLHSQKNVPMMIKACTRLFQEYPDYKLNIFGEGEERRKLENMIRILHMENHIFLRGFTNNIYQEIVCSSIYVSTSNYEGISNSMMEALGMGVPTVVTDCPVGGARLMIENNENGILVPVGDEDALYLAMKKILENKAFAEKLSINAYKVRNKYPVEKICKMWIELMP